MKLLNKNIHTQEDEKKNSRAHLVPAKHQK